MMTIEEMQDTAARIVDLNMNRKMQRSSMMLEMMTLEVEWQRLHVYIATQRDRAWWDQHYGASVRSFWKALTWSAGVPS